LVQLTVAAICFGFTDTINEIYFHQKYEILKALTTAGSAAEK
jgi:hypothetical protein